MKIIAFEIEHYTYAFEIGNFETEFHFHPAIEILLSVKGSFSLITPQSENHNLSFAIIDKNIKHQILAEACELRLLMIEHRDLKIYEILREENIDIENGLILNMIIPLEWIFFRLFKRIY